MVLVGPVIASSCWVSGLLTAAIYRMLTGRRERVWTLPIVGVTCCPLTWATVRVGNTSAIGGAMIGIVLWGGAQRTTCRRRLPSM